MDNKVLNYTALTIANSWLSKVIYGLVGLCGLYIITFYSQLNPHRHSQQ